MFFSFLNLSYKNFRQKKKIFFFFYGSFFKNLKSVFSDIIPEKKKAIEPKGIKKKKIQQYNWSNQYLIKTVKYIIKKWVYSIFN